jgi:tRNA-guanine family transglycosylase
LAPYPFAGFALGGMVPRIKRPAEILTIIRAIREVDSDRPLHVFGIGTPSLIVDLLRAGADSVDSSSYLRAATDGKYLDSQTGVWIKAEQGPVAERSCRCRSCQLLGMDYLTLEGEANRMALALHNLAVIVGAVSQLSAPTKC